MVGRPLPPRDLMALEAGMNDVNVSDHKPAMIQDDLRQVRVG
jgi:hypothetical protein